MPGVEAASAPRSTFGASGTERVWTRRIASRPARSGGCTATRRSKRPGRSSAGSRISGRFVAPSTITPVRGSKPSISVRIWLSVCSRSSWPPEKAPPRRARAADRVELVDEDDRGRGLLGLLEQVAHARGADADDHLDELRRRHLEERDVRLAGDRAREQRLAGARKAAQQHAAGDPAAEPQVLVGVAEEVDDLGQLLLGLVDPGDVLERDALLGALDAPRARAPERHQPAGAAAGGAGGATRDEHEQQDQQQRRAEAEDQALEERRAAVRGLGVDRDALALEQIRQLLVVRERRHLRREVGRRLARSCRRAGT